MTRGGTDPSGQRARPQEPSGGLPDGRPAPDEPDLDAPTDADPAPTQGPPTGEAADAQARQRLPAEIRMGEDIARAMAHHPPQRAAEEIATHIRKFWDPRMRSSIVGRVEAGEPMDDLLRAGVELYRQGEIDRAEVAEPSGG
ncbi:formate dehydrogenase subunit delta [uncultured Serinicoccus sp.]|uniref:formate dehydrogenase subunit delta n=1 Tax=uncultured Serinicoccus sp. TaxID=735514 RepID=UPI002636D388|nr:formate dehydrogenase subunit delta [uncultured Serinicoccus sp.]